MVSIGLSAILIIVFLLLPQNRFINAFAATVTLVNSSISYWLLRRGRVRFACWYYVTFLWLFIAASSLISSGIFSPHPAIFVVVILLAASLIDKKYAWVFAGLSIGAAFIFALLWQHADVWFDGNPQLKSQRAFVYWLIYSAIYIATVVIIEYIAEQRTLIIKQLQAKEAEREQAIAQLADAITQLTHSQVRLRQIFELAPIGIVTIGRDLRATQINQALAEMFNYDYATYELGTLLDYQSEQASQIYIENMTKLFSGEARTVHYDNFAKGKDGKEVWIRVTASIVADAQGQPDYVIAMLQDITETKQAEQHKIALVVEQERSEFLRDFMRHMTHDLKNPLSGIRTSAYLLQHKVTLNENTRYVDRINNAVDVLINMVDDILTTMQLDQIPELFLEPTDVNALLKKIYEQNQSIAEHKALQLTLELEPQVPLVLAHGEQLAYALLNVVQNAIKYTGEEGCIEIRTQQHEQEVHIEIQDTGIGISEKDLEHIFDPFYRSDAARSSEVGSGLGLSVVKKVIAMHHGRIEVESVVGEGTTFRIALPIQS